MSQFDLNDVRIFVTVVGSGTMSGAARKLGLPTSTVSRSVARLEKRMGMALVRRGLHGITITDAGAVYLPSCKEALQIIEQGLQSLSQQERDPSGLVNVSCPSTTAQHALAPLLLKFADQCPHVRIQIFTYTPGKVEIDTKLQDVLFHLWPLERAVGNIRRFPSSRRGIYAAKKYVESHGAPCSIDDIDKFDFIGSQGQGAMQRWKLISASGEVDLNPSFRLLACDPDMLRSMVLDGLGITTLPVWMAARSDVREHLVRVLPEWEPTPVPLFATCFRKEPLPPKIAKLLHFLDLHIGTASDPRAAGLDVAECFA